MAKRNVHSAAAATETHLLAVATEILVARGPRGLSVAELAREAGVSRPTVYRRWTDAQDVVRDVLAHRASALIAEVGSEPSTRDEIVDTTVTFTAHLESDPLFSRLLEREPETFTRWTFQRLGRAQRVLLDLLTTAVTRAQAHGSVRQGRPSDLAAMVLLLSQSTVLSHAAVAEVLDDATRQAELRHALDGYLRP
ncbi:TetR/AcrR family transcriptional regulator [Antribacter gilvus]|uniref:TetR/AcrR family transcriptional regulator n=1 Tax=Antribacter gilvus TaxID=2304675 RepID=UPI000F79D476|nr:TetR/AcrR family transcriptional regulator [Antribacter gilvus]